MIIELIGPSGAGKTAASMELLRKFPRIYPGRPSMGAGRIIHLLQLTMSLRFFIETYIRLVVSNKHFRSLWMNVSNRDRIRLVLWICLYRELSLKQRIYLFDQGLIQVVSYVIRRLPDRDRVRFLKYFYNVLKKSTFSVVVAHLSVNPQTAVRRTKYEQPLHVNCLDVELTCSSLLLNKAVLRDHFGAEIYDIDGEQPLGRLCQELILALNHNVAFRLAAVPASADPEGC